VGGRKRDDRERLELGEKGGEAFRLGFAWRGKRETGGGGARTGTGGGEGVDGSVVWGCVRGGSSMERRGSDGKGASVAVKPGGQGNKGKTWAKLASPRTKEEGRVLWRWGMGRSAGEREGKEEKQAAAPTQRRRGS